MNAAEAKTTDNPKPRALVQHFYLIDLFRGGASLAVLMWHYQHFYFRQPGGDPIFSSRAEQPLYALLSPLYEHGHAAVQFFWMISGFVLASRYAASGSSAWDFARNRFARLYPLHFLTLLIVAGLQILSVAVVGIQQIYPNNDLYHFVLQLFFASNWGFERTLTFNGPIWSVSVEIVIYAAFWLTHSFLFKRGALWPFLIVLICLVAKHNSDSAFWNCGFHFFAGSAAYMLYVHAKGRYWIVRVACAAALAAIALFGDVHQPTHLAIALMAFLLLISTLEHTIAGRIAQSQSWIGDNTYGAYLWHIPVQIIALIVIMKYGVPLSVIDSPFFLIGFLVIVSAIARVSFLTFERPMQSWLRTHLRVKKAAPLAPARSQA